MGAALAGRLTSTYFGATNANALGAVGGGESFTLALGQLPTGITATGTNNIAVSPNTYNSLAGSNTGVANATALQSGSGINVPNSSDGSPSTFRARAGDFRSSPES